LDRINSCPVKESRLRDIQVDITKLDYLIWNNTLNQMLQNYFLKDLPELMNIQNSQMKVFLAESINAIIDNECNTNKFVNEFLDDSKLRSTNNEVVIT
jgi:hypothetical protein